MPLGGGKYDKQVSELMNRLKADGIILIVVGGVKGEGFSVAGTIPFTMHVPQMLRTVADQVERDQPAVLDQMLRQGAKP